MSSMIPFLPYGGTGAAIRYRPENRFANYRSVSAIGNKIGNIIKRGWEQRKSRQAKTESRRKAAPKKDFKPSIGAQVGVGGGESMSKFTRVFPAKYKFVPKREFTPCTDVRSSGYRSSSGVGLQGAVLLGSYFDAVDIQNAFTAQGLTGAGQAAAKIMFNSVHASALLTNQHNSNARVKIYDVISRLDGGALNVDPVTVLKTGMVDAQGGAAVDWNKPGSDPYANPRFTATYRILQMTDVIISPGSTHTHVVNYAPNKYLSQERISTNGSVGPLGGLTIYSFMIHTGTPINDSTTKTTVSLSDSDIDVVIIDAVTYRYNSHTYASNSVSTTLPTSFAVAGDVMNEDGVVQVDAEA